MTVSELIGKVVAKKGEKENNNVGKLARFIDDVAAEELMDRYDTTGDGAWRLNDFFMCVLQGRVNKELHNRRMRQASMDIRAAGKSFSGVSSAKKQGRDINGDKAKNLKSPPKETTRQRQRETKKRKEQRKAERRRRVFFSTLTLDKCA